MTLTAPEHLKGDMRNRNARLREERLNWMLARAAEGHSGRAIARALNINPSRSSAILSEVGFIRRCCNNTEVLRSKGIQTGTAGNSIDAMPYDARDRLADVAAKTGKTMAAVLADFWAQHHGAQV